MPNNANRNTGINPRGSQWCYTVNNYTPDDVLRLRALHTDPKNKIVYHSFQAEIGKNGTPHLQGYVAFAATKMRSTVANIISKRAHLERTLGSPAEASDYCLDEEKRDPHKMDLFHTAGELATVPDQSTKNAEPGKRSDILAVKRKLDDGDDVWGIAQTDDHFGTAAKYWKFFLQYKSSRIAPRSTKTDVFVFYGAPGTGKSRAAFNFDKSFAVPASNGTQWMDGYDPDKHRVVIFDDFHASVPAHLLLRLCDGYPLQFPVKGGFAEFRPEAIVLTSNYRPEDWYNWPEIKADLQAFKRRVDEQWCYFLPETEADKSWCEENECHCLVKCEVGDWHPQLEEFIPRGGGLFGVPTDAIPATEILDGRHERYRTYVTGLPDASEDASPEVTDPIELSSDSSVSSSPESISSSS